MTYYSDQISSKMGQVLTGYIDIKSATTVPETSDVKLEKNQGFLVEATYVYADLVGSSKLAQSIKKPITAKIIRSYINGAADILRHYGGEIRSYDGDRVMAIFMSGNKETKAVRAALGVNWLAHDYLAPKIVDIWPDMPKYWRMAHSIGIDTGEALITRGGVRGDNDLISIGGAPNIAAKLSDRRDGSSLHITRAVYDAMDNEVAFAEPTTPFLGQQPMWSNLAMMQVGGQYINLLGSNYWWVPE